MTEIEVTCLPADLPEFIAVDLSGLKKGVSLHLADIKLPKGVTAVTHGKNNPVLVSVVVAGAEEPPEPPPLQPRPLRRCCRRRPRQGRRRQGRTGRQGSSGCQGPAAKK